MNVPRIILLAVALGGCAVPQNPPVVQEPDWDQPETRALAMKAGCFDCHSNETHWPWYTAVPGVNGQVVGHVMEGREEFNLSRMDRRQEEAHEAAEAVQEGEMPPAYYTVLHPSARLSDAERATLIRGLAATFGGEGGGEGREHDEDDD
jgi:cytochrome c551/c552